MCIIGHLQDEYHYQYILLPHTRWSTFLVTLIFDLTWIHELWHTTHSRPLAHTAPESTCLPKLLQQTCTMTVYLKLLYSCNKSRMDTAILCFHKPIRIKWNDSHIIRRIAEQLSHMMHGDILHTNIYCFYIWKGEIKQLECVAHKVEMMFSDTVLSLFLFECIWTGARIIFYTPNTPLK